MGARMWRTGSGKIYFSITLVLFLLFSFLFAYEEMIILVQAVIVLTIAALLVLGWYQFLFLKLNYQDKKLEVKAKEMRTRIIETAQGIWAISDENTEYVSLTGPHLRVNGHDRPLNRDEIFYASLKAKPAKVVDLYPVEEQKLLPEPETDFQGTLLDLIDQHTHTHIYGTTGGGR